MNNILIAFLLFIFQPLFLFAQQETFNCSKTMELYYNPPDKGLPNGNNITDKNAFCRGAEEAYSEKKFQLKWSVDPNYLDDCTRAAFEKYGISIICTGESELPEILDANAGYNFVMHQKIKLKLGVLYNKIGVSTSNSFSTSDIFNESFIKSFNTNLYISESFNGLLKLKLKKNPTLFPDYLNEIPVKDRESGKRFIFKDFYEGIVLPISAGEELSRIKLLQFLMKEFKHKDYCKLKSAADAYLVSISLKNFLDKWGSSDKWDE